MQTGTEFLILSGILTIIISAATGLLLGWKWYKQEVRLMTDLPLVFSISVISQAANSLVLTLSNTGVLESTMELFRFRTLLIGGGILPISATLLQIWAPSHKKHHSKTVILLIMYWFSVALLGTSETIIMMLAIPVMIGISIMMTVTFIVTWKTGRLKEVRSELLIGSILLAMASQVLKLSLMSTSMFYVPDVLLAISMIFIGLGIANPWYSKEKKSHHVEPPLIAPTAE
ncbi:MAG: hypothetical protein IH631_06220 [Candidatus Thorarchaeota archaeon]|nr:hypothetical protein [Candidatus Thorarchaeota archaeon]TFH11644.1 MAG: hypothetical protein E4H14_00360 [Candidatus Thorarchaeota archaeon]